MFAAEVLFHKALTFECSGHRVCCFPDPINPGREAGSWIWETLWVPSDLGYFCRGSGTWWGFEYGSRARLFLP